MELKGVEWNGGELEGKGSGFWRFETQIVIPKGSTSRDEIHTHISSRKLSRAVQSSGELLKAVKSFVS